jgi:predicted Fe-Mo cluster-binding NifX family protein
MNEKGGKNRMKVAIATEGNQVSAHFGRCQCYTIFDVDGNEIKGKSTVDTPGHQPGMLPRFLNDRGVDIVIAGGMGPKAQNLFGALNIQPIIGITGNVDDVIRDFVNGALEGGESLCDHGTEHHHGCDHD